MTTTDYVATPSTLPSLNTFEHVASSLNDMENFIYNIRDLFPVHRTTNDAIA